MTPRVKLLTLWVGELPSYVYDFVGRVRDISIVDWELLLYSDVEQVNRLVTERLGTTCNKRDGYCLSDIRPMLVEVFPNSVKGYEWWGWCEIDVVLGDLDRLLPSLLKRYDAVSAFGSTVSGPLMLLRNITECNTLFRKGDWKAVLSEPNYCNFEETLGAHIAGFHKDGGFTKLLRESGLTVWWDDSYSKWKGYPAGLTPYGCRLEGNRLLEVPTGRELLLYHFNHTKQWPTEALRT